MSINKFSRIECKHDEPCTMNEQAIVYSFHQLAEEHNNFVLETEILLAIGAKHTLRQWINNTGVEIGMKKITRFNIERLQTLMWIVANPRP